MEKKEVITFRQKILKGEKIRFSERIKDNGTIEKLVARFYSGQEMQLQVVPFVKHTGMKYEYLTTSPIGTVGYLAGDDDQFDFDIVVPVFYDDELIVDVENISTEYDYNLVIDVTIDYYQGTNRVIGGVV